MKLAFEELGKWVLLLSYGFGHWELKSDEEILQINEFVLI